MSEHCQSVESWRLGCITRGYLFGFYREVERQQAAGEPHDQDAAVRAGKKIERAVEKIVGPWGAKPNG